MKRYPSRLALVLAVGSILAPAAGGQSPDAPGDSLAEDPRLEVAVTRAEQDRPLGELVAALGREIQVPLRASRETADDKATLFLDARPAAEVMALIAREFDFQWYHHRDGYELGQTPASQQREADRRERDLDEELAAIQVEMERRPPLVDTPRRQLEEREKEIAQRVQSEDADESERSRLNEERAAIIDTLHPGRAPALAIFHSLTAPQVRQLLEGYDLWLSSADGTLPLPIAEQVQQAQRDAMQLSSWAPFFGFLGRDAWPPAEIEVVVRLVDSANDLEGPLPFGEPHLRLLFLVPLGSAENRERWGIPGWEAEGKRPEPPPVMATQTDDPALARLAALDFSRSAPPSSPNEESNPDRFPDREKWPPDLPTLADIGAALHQVTGLEVVADSFVRARLDARSAAALQANSRPVAQILDQVANELDYSWRKEGNLLFFRSRRYYQDRIEEVPERILRPWRQRVRRTGAATLDNLADLAAALNDSQVRGLQRYWGWNFAETPALPPSVDRGGFYASRQHLRFWASLTPQQRQAARSGAILPVARMGPRQARAFAAALDSRGQMGELCRPARREEISTGGFGYQGEPPGAPLDHTLVYYLGGELTPARKVSLQILGGDRL